jgi:uncharacterized membrane protein YbhN (UPF0104 family)
VSNRTFVIVLVIVVALVALAVAMHTPGGVGVMRSMRGALHGS